MKFPRTPHLPWSLGVTSDDRTMRDPEKRFSGKLITVTEKMDGENTVMTRDSCHARSEDSGYHPSRTWVKNLWGKVRSEIPEGWTVVGENMYAMHSIYYDKLPSYFLVFAVINNGIVLSTEDAAQCCRVLGLRHVPVLFTGLYAERLLRELPPMPSYGDASEGYVVRQERSFMLADWGEKAAKFVRANHVQTDNHWMCGSWIENKLKRGGVAEPG